MAGGSLGIGRAAALRLAGAGASVAILSRDADRARDVLEEIRERGHEALHVAADLTDPDATRGAVDAAVSQLGRLDILVASGAGGRVASRPFATTELRDYAEHYVGNLLARLYPIGAALPHMRRAGYGKIVALTSDGGRVPTPAQVLSGSAAAALMFAVRALAREIASDGVRVNAVSLSLTRGTPSFERFRARASDDVLGKVFARIESEAAFGLNTPEAVAETVLFLASPLSDQISGATISVNGGISFP